MPLLTLKHDYTKKSVAVIVFFAAMMFCIFTGCTQLSNTQKTSVSFCIDSTTAQQIITLAAGSNSSRAAESGTEVGAITEEILKNSKISVSLKGDYEETQTKDFELNGVSFSFNTVPVGAIIQAQAKIYYALADKLEITICEGESAAITVQEGRNILPVEFTIDIENTEKTVDPDPVDLDPVDPDLVEPEPDDPTPELYEYKYIEVNDNWHFSIFNEYLNVVSCKTATKNAITFTLNHELNQSDGMLQVVFGDSYYEEGKSYLCSYKIQGPVDTTTSTVTKMNVCWWVTKYQGNLFSEYNSTSPTESSFAITCDTTESGGILFFPTVPGEYTISDVSVIEIDPSAQSKTECTLEIKTDESDTFDDIQVTITINGNLINETSTGTISQSNTDSNYDIVFTAAVGFSNYNWQLKLRGEKIQSSQSNVFTIGTSDLIKGVYYDVVLFTDDKSYTRQLIISE